MRPFSLDRTSSGQVGNGSGSRAEAWRPWKTGVSQVLTPTSNFSHEHLKVTKALQSTWPRVWEMLLQVHPRTPCPFWRPCRIVFNPQRAGWGRVPAFSVKDKMHHLCSHPFCPNSIQWSTPHHKGSCNMWSLMRAAVSPAQAQENRQWIRKDSLQPPSYTRTGAGQHGNPRLWGSGTSSHVQRRLP